MTEPTAAEVAERDQRRKAYADLAELSHDLFVAFLVAGFNPDQSLELTMQGLEHGYHRELG